jgi:uncharacterized protein YqjF (DUF2071 family)
MSGTCDKVNRGGVRAVDEFAREALPLEHQHDASPSERGRRQFLECEGRPFLHSDWERVAFLHFEVPTASLQAHVPFELDCVGGRAFVSLVAFTLARLRFASGGRLVGRLCRLAGTPRLLNLRAYVRGPCGPGICFLTEWISSALHAVIGPTLYGLPYRWAELNYRYPLASGVWSGRVRDRAGRGEFRYEALAPDVPEEDRGEMRPVSCQPGSLDEFLLERYVAYTRVGRRDRFFGIWHEPWRQRRAGFAIKEASLLEAVAPWWPAARFIGAHVAKGVRDVWMGRPRFLSRRR